MKRFALFLIITSSTIFSCASTKKAPKNSQSVQSEDQNQEKPASVEDVRAEDENNTIAGGNIELLCQKALKFAPQDAVLSPEECQEKMNALQEKKQLLFAEVAKCVSEANDQAAMKFCNSQENPRYQNLE